MLTTSVVSARAVPMAMNAVQARAAIRRMVAPLIGIIVRDIFAHVWHHCAGRTSCRRSSPSASRVNPATFLVTPAMLRGVQR